jgi:hypothetical protein
MGEGAADEYGAIPGAKYEVIEHDGSFADLLANVSEIYKLAGEALARGDKPVVLVIDTMTSEWDLLKDWAGDRAKSSKTNRKRLELDPNAEIVITGNLWNDANARHRRLMSVLKTFPGIVLMTAHGKQVAVIGQDGQPIEGKKMHKVESQKTLGADASCWLRLYREAPGVIVGGRSVHLQFRPGDEPKPLASDWTLEGVIFGVLKCDTSTAHVRDLVQAKPDAVTPEQIRDEALATTTDVDRIRELYTEAKRLGYDDVIVINGEGDEEPLLAMLIRVGNERRGGPSRPVAVPQPARKPAEAGQPAGDELPSELAWASEFMARLGDTSTENGFRMRRSEVELAKAKQILTPETVEELNGEIAKREQALASEPAAA